MTPDLEALPNVGALVDNHYLVAELQKAIIAAPRDISRVRGAVLEVLRKDPPAFVDRVDPGTGSRVNRYTAEQFVKFITDPLPEGLESDVQTVGKLLEDDPEAYQVFVLALRRGDGNPTGANQHPKTTTGGTVDIINGSSPALPERPTGTSKGQAIRRLAKDRPGLPERVKAEEQLQRAVAWLSGERARVDAEGRADPAGRASPSAPRPAIDGKPPGRAPDASGPPRRPTGRLSPPARLPSRLASLSPRRTAASGGAGREARRPAAPGEAGHPPFRPGRPARRRRA